MVRVQGIDLERNYLEIPAAERLEFALNDIVKKNRLISVLPVDRAHWWYTIIFEEVI